MSEQSKIEQIADITKGDFAVTGSGGWGASGVQSHSEVHGSFGQQGHTGRISLTLRGVRLEQAVDNWLAAARAIQAAFEDGPATEPAEHLGADRHDSVRARARAEREGK